MGRSVAALIEAANQALLVRGDLDAIPEFFTPDHVTHLTGGDLAAGHEGVRRFVQGLRRAFPDLTVKIEVLVEEGDRVAWQRTLRGTHRRAFRGFPATGEPLVWRDMLTSRFEDGRIAEEWAISDLAERMLRARKR